MKRGRVIELWLVRFVLIAGLIAVVVLLGTAATDGPPMSERASGTLGNIVNSDKIGEWCCFDYC